MDSIQDEGVLELQVDSEQAMEALGQKVARHVSKGLFGYLEGDLGMGKTTFVRGFIHGCGYQGLVKSPTYTLVEPYSLKPGTNCYHFDLYRLSNPEELEFIGARDLFSEDSICLVEWPEKAEGYLPDADILCKITRAGSGRHVTIWPLTELGKMLMLEVIADT